MKILMKTALAGSVAAMALASTPAHAVATITCDNVANPTSCTYGNDDPAPGPATRFTDLFTFVLAVPRILSGDIFSQRSTNPDNFMENVNFVNPQGVRVQGGSLVSPVNFTVNSLGVTEARSISGLLLGAGTYQIRVQGTAGSTGTYSGNLVFGSVPEPTTWAFMILGFGLIGGALRYRKTTEARVTYA